MRRGLVNATTTTFILIDRHVPKNAGTTVRSIWLRNAQKRRCRFVGYDVSSTWRSAKLKSSAKFNHIAFGEFARKVRAGQRWCVEAHIVFDTFWSDLAALRGRCAYCRALVMVRVRHPYSWYRSYYSWAVFSKQRAGVSGLGANFTEWLPHNLQSRMLLFGDAAGAHRWEQKKIDQRPHSRDGHALSSQQWAGLHRILRAADIAAPLERFDEALVLLSHLSGGWLDTHYITHRPGPTHGSWEGRPQHTVPALESICAGVGTCEAAVDQQLARMSRQRRPAPL